MLGTNFLVPITSTLNVAFDDKNGYAYFATCTGTPPSSGLPNQFVGFIHGCMMVQTDIGTGTSAWFQNTGPTGTSPVWESVLADGSGSVQYGALSVLTNGTTAVNVFGATNGVTGTITGVFGVAADTTAGTITLASNSGTIAAFAKGTTQGGMAGSASLLLTGFASSGTMTVVSSSAGNENVTITFIYK